MLHRAPTKSLHLSSPSYTLDMFIAIRPIAIRRTAIKFLSIISGLPVSSWWQNGSGGQRFCRENTAQHKSRTTSTGRNERISVNKHFHCFYESHKLNIMFQVTYCHWIWRLKSTVHGLLENSIHFLLVTVQYLIIFK